MNRKLRRAQEKEQKLRNQDLNQALQLFQAGQPQQARRYYRKALALEAIKLKKHPANGEYLDQLATHEYRYRNYAAVAELMAKAVQLNPDKAQWHSNLGLALQETGDLAGAIKAQQRALQLVPGFAAAHYNLAMSYWHAGELAPAEAGIRRALELNPRLTEAWSSLGTLLIVKQCPDEAVAAFRQAMTLAPDNPRLFSTYLFHLHYLTACPPQQIYEAHLEYARRFEPVQQVSLTNNSDPGRVLRIGYLSGDFNAHPVGLFLAPVLAQHDPAQVSVYGYSVTEKPDRQTEVLRAQIPNWRDCIGLDDDALLALIRSDGIDILVDLAGHTTNNRMALFARRAAPVQLSWIGYFDTTGLQNMDYILADHALIPEDLPQEFTESVYRLPIGYLCFGVPDDLPPLSPPPLAANGYITFGSFNYLPKVNPEVVKSWAQILQQVPSSRLILKCKTFRFAEVRQLYLDMFAAQGIAEERIELRGASPYRQLLEQYGDIDIALDPFPYGGGTTTTEALLMGVPVVTCSGDSYAGRISTSILSAIDMPSLITGNLDDYIARVVELAGNTALLSEMRQVLRTKVQSSTLGDATRFTPQLEAAYREMWHRWCHREVKG